MFSNRNEFVGNNTVKKEAANIKEKMIKEKKKKNIRGIKFGFCKLLEDPIAYPLAWIQKTSKANIDKKNADKDFSIRMYAASLAAQYNRVDVLKWLVEDMRCPVSIRPVIHHPLIVAIQANKMEAFKWLLEKNAEQGIEGYCVEACIYYNNLPALEYMLADEEFPFALGEKSFIYKTKDAATVDESITTENLQKDDEFIFPLEGKSSISSSSNTVTFDENITTYMIKHDRFDMLLWMLENTEFVYTFRDDFRKESTKTLPCLYAYFESLEQSQLESLRNHLQVAFDNLKISTHNDAIEIMNKLDVSIGKEESSTPVTPGLSRGNSASSSPKKHAHFSSQDLMARVASLKIESNELPDEFDMLIDVKKIATSSGMFITASKNTGVQTVSPVSTSPKKLLNLSSIDFWSQSSSLKNGEVAEVNEKLELGSYKR